jgi:carboxylesterase type B
MYKRPRQNGILRGTAFAQFLERLDNMAAVLKTKIGSFEGKKGDGVMQYLGIQYARLGDQLAAPELVQDYGNEVVDATRYGYVLPLSPFMCHPVLRPVRLEFDYLAKAACNRPRAPAMDGCAFEQTTLIQCNIGPAADEPKMSGTECLNLNITVPDIDTNEKLPVMVWFHGGGFIMGANYWPQYDSSRLVRMSVEAKMPVVVVSIK